MPIIAVGDSVALVDDADFETVSRHSWCISRKYAVTSIGRKSTRMHNLIMGGLGVDHIDGNCLNNTRKNLRFCNQSQNIANSKLSAKSTSGYKGVSWHKQDAMWRAHITFRYKFIHIGLFKDKVAAALAYNKKAKELFGEFAKLNEVPA